MLLAVLLSGHNPPIDAVLPGVDKIVRAPHQCQRRKVEPERLSYGQRQLNAVEVSFSASVKACRAPRIKDACALAQGV